MYRAREGRENMPDMMDVIVIGKGPAGISAAVYMKRAGISVLVIGKGFGALEKSEKIENYYGFENPISGRELVENGIRQAENLGIKIISEEVTSLMPGDGFEIKTPKGIYNGRAVLLATGKSRSGVGIRGVDRLRGSGVSFCAVCDGFFYRGKKIGVIGSGEYAAEELSELTAFTKNITLFTNGLPLTTDKIPEGITVVKAPIDEVAGAQKVEAVVAGGEKYELDGVFIAIGTASAADFAAKNGMQLKGGDILVDENFMTNIPGLFAAGDCIGGFLQVTKAVSDGAHASKAIIKYIKELRKT